MWFRGSDVISTGDLFNLDTYPVIDLKRGGSINGVIEALMADRDNDGYFETATKVVAAEEPAA